MDLYARLVERAMLRADNRAGLPGKTAPGMGKTAGRKYDAFVESNPFTPVNLANKPMRFIANRMSAPDDEWMDDADHDGLWGKFKSTVIPGYAAYRNARRAKYYRQAGEARQRAWREKQLGLAAQDTPPTVGEAPAQASGALDKWREWSAANPEWSTAAGGVAGFAGGGLLARLLGVKSAAGTMGMGLLGALLAAAAQNYYANGGRFQFGKQASDMARAQSLAARHSRR